jgi:hypothetical protein
MKYFGKKRLATRQVLFSHNMTIVSGTPQQLPGFRVLPGMEAIAFVGRLAAATDNVYLAKNPRPRIAANTPGAGAIVLSGGSAEQVNLDGDLLSQWFVDADGADQLNIVVYANREEQFV